uniref:Fe2OG dioxygenase domain-containing protein n=1 Tax=Setaria italica TaxID=4555 RepID=K4A4Z7_SETIT
MGAGRSKTTWPNPCWRHRPDVGRTPGGDAARSGESTKPPCRQRGTTLTAGPGLPLSPGRSRRVLRPSIAEPVVTSHSHSHSRSSTTSQFTQSSTQAEHQGMADQLISTAVHEELPENYVRPEAQRPRLHEVVSDAQIPVVDLADPDPAAVVASIGEACTTHGFFQVLNHGVPVELMVAMLAVAYEFFRLPAEEKAKLYSDDPGKKMRLSTSFNVRKETVHNWRDYLRLHCYPLEQYVPDWPANPPSFREIVSAYCREVRALGFRLYEAISASLGLEDDYVKRTLGEQEQHMAVNFYPRCPAPELTYGLPAHTDPNALTILLMDQQVAGLQVLNDGRWIAVNPRPNALVINIGDQLQALSNGRYKSVWHRAVLNSDRPWMSVASFLCPCNDVRIGPALSVLSPSIAEPVVTSTYVASLRGKHGARTRTRAAAQHHNSRRAALKPGIRAWRTSSSPRPCTRSCRRATSGRHTCTTRASLVHARHGPSYLDRQTAAMPAMDAHQAVTTGGGGTGGYVEFLGKVWGALAGLGKKLAKIVTDDPRRVVHSFKVGLALTLVSVLYYVHPIFNNWGLSTLWAVLITVAVVMDYTVGGTLIKGLNRATATLVAGLIAVGAHKVANLGGSKGEPIIILAIFVFLLATAATFTRFIPAVKAWYDYSVTIFILTFSMVAVSSYRVEELIRLAYQRSFTIFVGVATCLFTTMFVCPVWAGEDLHNLAAENLDKLAEFLEGLESECFGENAPGEDLESKPFLQVYKSVLDCKATEDSLANFAKWEPGHGNFYFRYPWGQYQNIGAVARQCASSMQTLASYIITLIKAQRPETNLELCSKVRTACGEMSLHSAKALRALSAAIQARTVPSPAMTHMTAAIRAAKGLKAELSQDEDLAKVMHVAGIASLLSEVVSQTKKITESVGNLAKVAGFKSPDENTDQKDVVIIIDDLKVNGPTSPLPASPPTKKPAVPRMVNTHKNAPSVDIDKFSNVLKKKASSSGEKYITHSAFPQKEKDQNLNFFASDDVPMDYEHGKPFLYQWEPLKGPWELMHGWIMNAMKQDIQAITAHVPTKVFLGVLPYQIVIDFEDLYRLYHRQHLDVNLISVWCLMQWREEELAHGRFKVAYLDPARISEPEHKLKMTETIKAQIEAAETQAEKNAIKIKAHRDEMHKVSIYIAKVMQKKADKDYIMAPYCFDDHWICIIILHKLGEAVVLDSTSYHRDKYKDFIDIIQK